MEDDHPLLGFQTYYLNHTTWTVPQRYQNLTPIGQGAYGCVCVATDMKSQEKVAIKKLARPFPYAVLAKRTYRELVLLRQMKHENVVDLRDVILPAAKLIDFDELYFVSTYMESDLSQILKVQRLSESHIQLIIYSILRGLKYLHSAGIVHRDLKPANIAMSQDCDVRIIDLGLARQEDDEMTGYVATRWYRAPEVMLNWMHYSNKVDIWSVGCIMGEMYKGSPLFPGQDHIKQLTMTLKMVGTPDKEYLSKLECKEGKAFLKRLPAAKRQKFKDVFPNASSLAISILDEMMQLDPLKRPDAGVALRHKFFEEYHDPQDEPEAPPIECKDDGDHTVDDWKEIIWNEIHDFWKEKREAKRKMKRVSQ